MSDNHPGSLPPPQSGGDLEYDLAHEAMGDDVAVRHHEDGPAVVVTATPDYDGDYTYDLAHDIPGR